MEQVLKLLQHLPEDSHVLTVRLYQAMRACYQTPRLRRRLTEIPLAKFKDHLPDSSSKDLTYLLAGLMAISGFEIDPFPPTAFVRELGEYLKQGARYGISIGQFLAGSLTPWPEIRPKYQEQIRIQLGRELQDLFPKLNEDFSLRNAQYLLSNELARVAPAFPFHRTEITVPIVLVRPQAGLPWTIASEPQHVLDAFYVHFPEIAWKGGGLGQQIFFVGVRLLSPLSAETSLLLKKSLSKLDYHATTRVEGREKLLSLVFLSQSDANLFQFNLRHYAKFSSFHHQIVPIQLSEYRKGYPGFSGFFELEVIEKAGL
jgi:hypothetical protein